MAKRSRAVAHDDIPARLAWADELASRGLRAAAMHEVFAIQKLGGQVPHDLLEKATLPEWTFAPFSRTLDGIAPALADSMFPGARVRRGGYEYPLALALSPMCSTCDDEGMVACTMCDGLGTKQGFSNPDAEYECPTREPCRKCWGLKFLIRGVRKKRSECTHARLEVEANSTHFTLRRCTSCLLPVIRTDGGLRNFAACAECTQLECIC